MARGASRRIPWSSPDERHASSDLDPALSLSAQRGSAIWEHRFPRGLAETETSLPNDRPPTPTQTIETAWKTPDPDPWNTPDPDVSPCQTGCRQQRDSLGLGHRDGAPIYRPCWRALLRGEQHVEPRRRGGGPQTRRVTRATANQSRRRRVRPRGGGRGAVVRHSARKDDASGSFPTRAYSSTSHRAVRFDRHPAAPDTSRRFVARRVPRRLLRVQFELRADRAAVSRSCR